MFATYVKNYRAQRFANTWQQTLKKREVIRNSYRANGDIKKAKDFVNMVYQFTFQPINEVVYEQVIFSDDEVAGCGMLSIALPKQ